MIYYLMGKSASGKDTLYRRLRELRPDWQEVVLYTTRPMRTGEIEGKTYHFVTAEQMAALRAAGRLIEERVYQTAYGPWSYATVDDGQIHEPAHRDYLMIGTLESYVKVRQYYGEALLRPCISRCRMRFGWPGPGNGRRRKRSRVLMSWRGAFRPMPSTLHRRSSRLRDSPTLSESRSGKMYR